MCLGSAHVQTACPASLDLHSNSVGWGRRGRGKLGLRDEARPTGVAHLTGLGLTFNSSCLSSCGIPQIFTCLKPENKPDPLRTHISRPYA